MLLGLSVTTLSAIKTQRLEEEDGAKSSTMSAGLTEVSAVDHSAGQARDLHLQSFFCPTMGSL